MTDTQQRDDQSRADRLNTDGQQREAQDSPANLRSGYAKIISNDGSGDYTVTEQWRTAGDADANATSPPGLVSVSARDIRDAAAGQADDIVQFWQARKIDGTIETLIESRRSDSPEPFARDFWFDVTGDKAIADVDDTVDYRNRIIDTMAFYDSGGPVDGGSWNEDNVFIYDINAIARAQADPGGMNIGQSVISNPTFGIKTTLIFVDKTATLGDFYLKVDQDTGDLQALSENFNARYQVRVRIMAGGQIAAASATDIS